MKTLEQYIRSQYAPEIGRIDFRFRAHIVDGRVEIYIHPLDKDGETTPTLIVDGDTVRPRHDVALDIELSDAGSRTELRGCRS